jgi:hypothetical protein
MEKEKKIYNVDPLSKSLKAASPLAMAALLAWARSAAGGGGGGGWALASAT